MRQFGAPEHFDASKAVTIKDATDSSAENARGVVRELHVNWGHASANRLKRILAGLTGGVVGRFEACQAFDMGSPLSGRRDPPGGPVYW